MTVVTAAIGLLLGSGIASASSQDAGSGDLAIAPVSMVPAKALGKRVGGPQQLPTNLTRMWDGRVVGKAKITRPRTVVRSGKSIRRTQALAAITPRITSAPTNPSTSRSASFSFRGFELFITFQCSLDGAAYTTCSSPRSYTNLAYGSHTFRVRVRDLLGRLSAPASATWQVVPPAPTIVTRPANPSTTAVSTFTFTSTEPTATFQCRIDAGAFAPCTSGFSTTVETLGSHTFGVRALVGTVAGPEATYTWTYGVSTTPTGPVKGKVLLIAATADEIDLAAIRQTLDFAGVPYETLIASTTDLTAARLATGTTGNYQAVILSTGNLTWLNPATNAYESAFTQAEWDILWAYEAQFKVRQATMYTYPLGYPDDYGLTIQTPQFQDTTTAPLSGTLTTAGRQVFPYLNPATPVTWKSAWVYLATKRDANVTPLIQTASGQVIASTRVYPDGRENLAITGQNAPYLLHSQLLGFGVLNWVTRGLYVGKRISAINVQIDDLLIDSDMWDVNANSDLTGLSYRTDANDWNRLVAWQNSWRANPLFSTLRLEWAFNGEGAFGDPFPGISPYPNDTLTPAVRAGAGNFWYTNHTYRHENVDLTDYATSLAELRTNQQAAALLGFNSSNYTPDTMVQPDISGLTNPNFLQAAFDAGIRYLISDTSRPEWNNPSPNAGFVPASRPEILVIPRHPTNLFYNIRTPEEWVDEYNWYFCLCSPSTSPWKVWPTAKTYAEIIDLESDMLLSYLLKGDIDPLMFHQANAGTYDGVHSTMSDLFDATFTKYRNVFNVPVKNLNMRQAGQLTAQRMGLNASGVQATIDPCRSITLTVTRSADIPLTGAVAGTTETYGGQIQSVVRVDPGAPRTIPVTC